MYDGRRSKIERVQKHMKQKKIDYPILFDCGGRMWKELGLRGYPTAIGWLSWSVVATSTLNDWLKSLVDWF